jgi:hypothetical protein
MGPTMEERLAAVEIGLARREEWEKATGHRLEAIEKTGEESLDLIREFVRSFTTLKSEHDGQMAYDRARKEREEETKRDAAARTNSWRGLAFSVTGSLLVLAVVLLATHLAGGK